MHCQGNKNYDCFIPKAIAALSSITNAAYFNHKVEPHHEDEQWSGGKFHAF
jgi:hypothetical protein